MSSLSGTNSTVTPGLLYHDAANAIEWLCRVSATVGPHPEPVPGPVPGMKPSWSRYPIADSRAAWLHRPRGPISASRARGLAAVARLTPY